MTKLHILSGNEITTFKRPGLTKVTCVTVNSYTIRKFALTLICIARKDQYRDFSTAQPVTPSIYHHLGGGIIIYLH